MAHFNFVISQNAKWGHVGFYIDCHRMTVPENILLQKKHWPTVSGHRFKFHCSLLHWTKVSSVTTHDKKRYSTFLRLRVISIKSVTRSCRPFQQRLGHIYRLWHRATIAMKYVELIQNVHTGSVMSNILKHLTQTPIVFCFYDETLRRFRRIVPPKMAERRDPPTAGSMEVARLFLAKSATCLMRMKVQSSDCRVSTTLQIWKYQAG